MATFDANTRLAPCIRYAIERVQHDNAGVVELVDTPDLGSGAFRFGGSSPSARTIEDLSLIHI